MATPVSLQPGIALGTSPTPLYTAPPKGLVALPKTAVFANTSGAAVTVTVIVQRGGGAAMVLIPALSVPANGTAIPAEIANLVLTTSDVLSAQASVSNVVNAFVSGFTV